MPHIGTLTEKSLHAALKAHFARPGDELEVPVEGFVIDIVRGNELTEIQTGGFTALKRKLAALLAVGYHVHLVHPIPAVKWIVREAGGGRRAGRRKSPRRGRVLDVFAELVRIPHLLAAPGFSLEVVLTHQEEVRTDDGRGSWRRKGWSLADHRLLEVVETQVFRNREDYLACLPPDLPRPFTNRALSQSLGAPLWLAQKMTYTLEKAGWLERAGKEGRAHLFSARE
ncbi:MAG TPA: hypothetical protein VMN57_02965 [Anaerolineales bacterium]|nr:hypothetical protein [Anaerolineales bacterium]